MPPSCRAALPKGSESELIAPAEAQGRAGALIVAREHGRPVGCGALRTFAPGIGEIRHLWVDPAARGLGLSRRLMEELEEQARSRGHRKVCLDTSDLLEVAIGLYRTSGYREVPAYNHNPHAHRWFEKRLPPAARRRTRR
jgi:GNAT superfamily N-acetyltransferase